MKRLALLITGILSSVLFLSGMPLYGAHISKENRSAAYPLSLAKRDYENRSPATITDPSTITLQNYEQYAHYLKGLFYIHNQDFEKALAELQKAKKLDPGSVYIRIKLATVLIRLEKFSEAEKELKEAKALDPKNLDASLALLFLYSYSQNNQALDAEYKDFLERAHLERPDDIRITEQLAQYYFYKRQLLEAIALYQTITKSNPEYAGGWFWLGFLYEENGQRQQALAAWEKTLQIDPNYSQALNSIAYTYAVEGTNLSKARKLVEKALEIEPDTGAYLDTLGWIYYKQGDYGQALRYLKQALAVTKDPVIYEHAGDVLISLKKIPEAVKYYKEGLQYFPSNENLQKKVKQYE